MDFTFSWRSLKQNYTKEYFADNPNIKVLANNSFILIWNLLKNYGFGIINLVERKNIVFQNDLYLTRFPATGIDNFLLIEYQNKKFLNLNDVVLSNIALKLIAKKIETSKYIFKF